MALVNRRDGRELFLGLTIFVSFLVLVIEKKVVTFARDGCDAMPDRGSSSRAAPPAHTAAQNQAERVNHRSIPHTTTISNLAFAQGDLKSTKVPLFDIIEDCTHWCL